MPEQPGILRQSYLSVTDFQFYCTVLDQPWRKSLRYLAFWVTLTALFTSAEFLVRFHPVVTRVGGWLALNLPPMEVRNGKLGTSAPVPYRAQTDQPDVRVVVDPTDSVRQPSSKEGVELIFNSDRIHLQIQGREDTYAFSPKDNFKIDRQAVEQWRKLVQWFFIPFSLLVLWPWYLFAKCAQVVFLVGCGVFLSRPGKLTPRQWTNISVYSLTPAILIGMIFQATTVPVQVAWCFYVGTATIYAMLAGRRCSPNTPALV